jgi:hypothetical protein
MSQHHTRFASCATSSRDRWVGSRLRVLRCASNRSLRSMRYMVPSDAAYWPSSASAGTTCFGGKFRNLGLVRTEITMLSLRVAHPIVRDAFGCRASVRSTRSFPPLYRARVESEFRASRPLPCPRCHGFVDQVEDSSSFFDSVEASSSLHRASAFFRSTRIAAASANAFSFRRSSRSSSLMRFASADFTPTLRDPRSDSSAPASTDCFHCRSCSSCNPSRRRNSPRSDSESLSSRITASSFSSADQSSGLRLGWGSTGSRTRLGTPSNLRASRSRFGSAG